MTDPRDDGHPRGDLPLHLTGDLDDDAAAELESHLATCAPCRRELAELRATLGALRSLDAGAPPLPAALAALAPPPAGAVRRGSPLARIAAVAALFIAGLVVGRALSPPTPIREEPSLRAPGWMADPGIHRAHGLGRALLALRAAERER